MNFPGLRPDRTRTLLWVTLSFWVLQVFCQVAVPRGTSSLCEWYQVCGCLPPQHWDSPAPPIHLLVLCFWFSDAFAFFYFSASSYYNRFTTLITFTFTSFENSRTLISFRHLVHTHPPHFDNIGVSFPTLSSGALSRDVIVKKCVFHEKRTGARGRCPIQRCELVFPPAVQSLKEQKSAFSRWSSSSAACYLTVWCHERPATPTRLIFHSLLASFPEEKESEKIYC